jgi:hypothetical protein
LGFGISVIEISVSTATELVNVPAENISNDDGDDDDDDDDDDDNDLKRLIKLLTPMICQIHHCLSF